MYPSRDQRAEIDDLYAADPCPVEHRGDPLVFARRHFDLGSRSAFAIGLFVAALFFTAGVSAEEAKSDRWKNLAPGLDLGVYESPIPSGVGDSLIHVVRVDPERAELVLMNASAEEVPRSRTARQWAADRGLVAVINASMFQRDMKTSTALMRTVGHVNNKNVSSDNAVLAFGRRDKGVPRAQIIDRRCQDFDAASTHYDTLIQGIRMVSCEGVNTWSQQARKWSHAVLGIDKQRRLLLIHARSPWTSHDLVEILLGLPIGLSQLQYAEGGPEAQLFVGAGGVELERVGSYETGFYESDKNHRAWAIPNVIGVRLRK
jgi:hypothetical protein